MIPYWSLYQNFEQTTEASEIAEGIDGLLISSTSSYKERKLHFATKSILIFKKKMLVYSRLLLKGALK